MRKTLMNTLEHGSIKIWSLKFPFLFPYFLFFSLRDQKFKTLIFLLSFNRHMQNFENRSNACSCHIPEI